MAIVYKGVRRKSKSIKALCSILLQTRTEISTTLPEQRRCRNKKACCVVEWKHTSLGCKAVFAIKKVPACSFAKLRGCWEVLSQETNGICFYSFHQTFQILEYVFLSVLVSEYFFSRNELNTVKNRSIWSFTSLPHWPFFNLPFACKTTEEQFRATRALTFLPRTQAKPTILHFKMSSLSPSDHLSACGFEEILKLAIITN